MGSPVALSFSIRRWYAMQQRAGVGLQGVESPRWTVCASIDAVWQGEAQLALKSSSHSSASPESGTTFRAERQSWGTTPTQPA